MRTLLAAVFLLFAAPALAAPTSTLSVADASCVEGKGCSFVVSRTGSSSQTASFTYSASSPDIVPASGAQSVRKGASRQTVTVQTKENLLVDGTRKFLFTIKAGSSNVAIARAQATGSVLDNDTAPPVVTPPPTCPDGSPVPPGGCVTVPPSSGHRDNVLASEGDSQSQSWGQTSLAGNWTDVYRTDAKARGLVEHCALAVGGSTIDKPGATGNNLNNPQRLAKIDACDPEVVVFSPTGSNDLVSWNPAFTAESWLSNLWSWADPLVAKGYKVLIGTPLPQGPAANSSVPTWSTDWEARRTEVKSKLKAQAPAHGVTLVDFTGSKVDPASAVFDRTLYNADQLHLSDCSGPTGTGGQCEAYRVVKPYLDAALGLAGSIPLPQPPVVQPPIALGVGLPAIASNFPISDAVKPNPNPIASNAPDNVGAFRFICGAGQLNYDDAQLYPGQPGKAHLHQWFGNTTGDANAAYGTLRAKGDSTCNFTGKGVAANRSSYYVPAMLDGRGNVVKPAYIQTYYKAVPASSAECLQITGDAAKCVPIPNGLEFIFGYDMQTGKAATYPGHFHCEGAGATTVVTYDIPPQADYCKPGSVLVALLDTPKCWNGKDVKSADHRSHLSDMVRNDWSGWVSKCPATHPYLIPQFTLGLHYLVAEGDDLSLWSLSSDAMYPDLPKGSTFHSDYQEAWDVPTKLDWTSGCINKLLNCSAGETGSGTQLIGAAAGDYPPQALRVPVPPRP